MISRKLVLYSKDNSKNGVDTDKRLSLQPRICRSMAITICLSIMVSANITLGQTVTVNTTSDAHASNPTSSATSTAGGVSLRSAIEYADYHSGTTVSVGPGTYNLTLGEIQIGAISSPFTTTISGAGASSTIINQTDGINRIFDIDPNIGGGITCTITGVTIEHGQDKADSYGGGGIIDGEGGSGTSSDRLTLTNCTIQSNSAYGNASVQEPVAGGVEMDGGYLTLTNCTISSNTLVTNSYGGDAAGAGVAFIPFATSETLTISGCTFSGNSVNASSASGQGAGLYVKNSIVGGAGVSITNTVFSSNTFTSTGSNHGEGGGVYISEGGTLTMTGCTFTGNSASGTGGLGGAIDIIGGTANINYCRFSGNGATTDANIHNVGGTITATNDWWANNSGATGTTAGITVSPYLKLTNTAARTTINSGDTTKLTASFLTNSSGSSISASNLGALNGLGVSWGSPVLGTLSNQQISISSGVATATFTAGGTAGSNGSAQAAVDGVTATTSPTITVQIPPTVTTGSATSITQTGVTLNGTVNANNLSTAVSFEYGLTTSYGTSITANQSPVTGASNTAVSKAIAGLVPNTTYHFRVDGTNTAGTSDGSDQTFTTSAAAATVSTDSASAITTTTATLYGTVNANNASTTVTIQYGLTNSYGNSVTATQSPVAGTTNTSVSGAVTGLTAGTLYHYRIVGVNAGGTTNGGDLTFTTKDQSLAVEVSSFKAAASYNSVTLTWQTQSEVENAGFNILREDPGTGAFKLVSSYTSNDSLRGLGTSSTGQTYDFTDSRVISGTVYQYEIQSVTSDGFTKNIDTVQVTVAVPKNFALYQNYPNPFNPTTVIGYQLSAVSHVTLTIYDVLGREVATLVDGQQNAGVYKANFDGSRFASGVYFYRINAVGNDGQKFISIKKLVLMK
jgi:hypothetical protein